MEKFRGYVEGVVPLVGKEEQVMASIEHSLEECVCMCGNELEEGDPILFKISDV